MEDEDYIPDECYLDYWMVSREVGDVPYEAFPLSRRRGAGGGVRARPRERIGVKEVFAVMVFAALTSAIIDPGFLLFTLPASIAACLFLSMAWRRGGRRKPRRLRAGW